MWTLNYGGTDCKNGLDIIVKMDGEQNAGEINLTVMPIKS